VGRNVASLVKPPQGKTGRPSRAMTAAEAAALLTGSADRDETGCRTYSAAPLIEQAMMGYGTAGPPHRGERGGSPAWTSCVRRCAPRTRPIRSPGSPAPSATGNGAPWTP
jgi:hypothetical protein